jgi:CRISPR-associated exonuclease Cas4
LIGKADVVEFHEDTPYPVEYKHGPRREKEHDDLQVCAQALCLEDMTGKEVPRGAIYHHSSRRRREVVFTPALRQRVEEAVIGIRGMLESSTLPPPVNDRRCEHCSLRESCMPAVIGEQERARVLVHGLFVAKGS